MPCSSASWSCQPRKAKNQQQHASTLSIDRFYARSISCKHWNAFALKICYWIFTRCHCCFFAFSSYSFTILVFVRLADDMNMWKVINCIDKRQIGALASKSASVFIESSNANSDFVHQTKQNRRQNKKRMKKNKQTLFKLCLATAFVVIGWYFCFSGEKSHSKLISWSATVQYTWFR